MSRFEGRGHGKLILTGEHAVVYGHAALAVAVDRGTTVRLWSCEGATRTDPTTPCDDRLQMALLRALPAQGWCVQIESDVPIGRGMGSSAALSVGLVRALANAEGRAPDTTTIFEQSLALERIFHGTPSGLDNAVSARGGALRYRRGPPASFVTVPCPTWPLVVLDSGVSGNTAQLVAEVGRRRPSIDPVLHAIGELVTEVERALGSPEDLGPLLTQNHELLRRIGVSNNVLDGMVDLALRAGASGAKLAGAGGGGVVIALAPDPDAIVRAAINAGMNAFICHPVPRAAQ
ncbi:MAG: mevalonate kinase [Kiritimatiellia bacterium]|jgi:mevalonate kinase